MKKPHCKCTDYFYNSSIDKILNFVLLVLIKSNIFRSLAFYTLLGL